MRRNYPRNTRRNPEECYDHIYRAMPGRPHVNRIIHHPRKLVIHNLCADLHCSAPEEVFWARTCYDDDSDD